MIAIAAFVLSLILTLPGEIGGNSGFADLSRATTEGATIRTDVLAVPYPARRIKKPENIDPNKKLSSNEKRSMIMTGLAVLIAAIAFGFLVRSKTK